MMLRALQVTSDPKKLKQMLGLHSVAQVYQTLDRLSIRKEYHNALQAAGLDMGSIVNKLKHLTLYAEDEGVQLRATLAILKSLGLEKYENDAEAGGSFEQELLKTLEKQKEVPAQAKAENVIDSGELPKEFQIEDYEVNVPEIPDSMKQLRKNEDDLTKRLYGTG